MLLRYIRKMQTFVSNEKVFQVFCTKGIAITPVATKRLPSHDAGNLGSHGCPERCSVQQQPQPPRPPRTAAGEAPGKATDAEKADYAQGDEPLRARALRLERFERLFWLPGKKRLLAREARRGFGERWLSKRHGRIPSRARARNSRDRTR